MCSLSCVCVAGDLPSRSGQQRRSSARLRGSALETSLFSLRRADSFKTTEEIEGKKAMEIEYVQSPQDGSADAVLNLALAPSYITYNAASIQRVSGFFASEKVRKGTATARADVPNMRQTRCQLHIPCCHTQSSPSAAVQPA